MNEEINPAIIAELKELFYTYSPSQMGFHLRKLLVCFVLSERDKPDYYDELVHSIDWLLDFLEVADYIGVHTDMEKAHMVRYQFIKDEDTMGS